LSRRPRIACRSFFGPMPSPVDRLGRCASLAVSRPVSVPASVSSRDVSPVQVASNDVLYALRMPSFHRLFWWVCLMDSARQPPGAAASPRTAAPLESPFASRTYKVGRNCIDRP
jgi:hypothetical protein